MDSARSIFPPNEPPSLLAFEQGKELATAPPHVYLLCSRPRASAAGPCARRPRSPRSPQSPQSAASRVLNPGSLTSHLQPKDPLRLVCLHSKERITHLKKSIGVLWERGESSKLGWKDVSQGLLMLEMDEALSPPPPSALA